MQPTDVVAGRFEIERLAGAGGMGAVYRARDRATGASVALKLLHLTGRLEVARFEREAELLAELAHPGLVRYVAHGRAASGQPFLAMEWLDGEDLGQRLGRGPLAVDEAVALGWRAAEALAVVHARGVVHRDLKPTNLFLVDGAAAQVKVIDFGIARLSASQVTVPGMLIGTPGYMAPEQARTEQSVDARADVFSLGCVLFECLTGSPPWGGEHMMAVLAKILFDQAPRVRDLRPEVPRDLDALVAWMLAKEPDARPRDGGEVAKALAELGAGEAAEEPGAMSARMALTGRERRLLSVVIAGSKDAPRGGPADPTVAESAVRAAQQELRDAATARGGEMEVLADGTVVVTLAGAGVATDQAAEAARCALALRALADGRPIALATGRGQVGGRLPIGEAIDRAARMLARLGRGGEEAAQPISLDEVTAGLLDGRFDVRVTAWGSGGAAGLDPAEGPSVERWFALHGEREAGADGRTLLGKPTSCVGRERELSALMALVAECVEVPRAQAALVTGGAGMGKSRLAHELLRRVREAEPEAEIWIARGDPLRAGSAFGLLGQALQRACGVQGGEPPHVQQRKLTERAARRLPASKARWVAEMLGEIAGAPFPDEESRELRAARQDPQRMGEEMRRAFEEFVAAEAAARPILLVLEDLHWGDLPTVRFLDAALRSQADLPFMVLALGRPEVHDRFPRLWAERGVQEVRLRELTRKASEQLARQVLGAEVDAALVARLVAQADGNAFYLEELIRAVAEGKGAALPETVVSMVQSRLAGLADEARQVLRAASVFGEVCWAGGVAALLGGAVRAAEVDERLAALVEREVLVRRPESRFLGEQELAFRHALLREGAYATLTEADRALGHRLAAAFLEGHGEPDPVVLAGHLERGGDPMRAGAHYLRAAEQALRGGDIGAAMARAQQGLACDVPSEVRVSLLGLLCEAHAWRSETEAAARYAQEVMRLSAPGSAPWTRAAVVKLGDTPGPEGLADFVVTLDAVARVEPSAEAAAGVTFAFHAGVFVLEWAGHLAPAEARIEHFHAAFAPFAARDPLARAWLAMTGAHREGAIKGNPWAGLRHGEVAMASFEEAGHERGRLLAQTFVGINACLLGAHGRAEQALRATRDADGDRGPLASLRTLFLGKALLRRGAIAEAREGAARLIEAGRARGHRTREGRGHWALAEALLQEGDLGGAGREARAAVELLGAAPLDRVGARATLARVTLGRGDAAEALAVAEEALAEHEALGQPALAAAGLWLVYAEALIGAGEAEEGHAVLAAARARLEAMAERIGDAELRRGFLEEVPEHARTLGGFQGGS